MADALNIMRHESIFNPADAPFPMHIIGAGATGSRVFSALIELGVQNIAVYDPDIVEDHNLANQIYMASDVGRAKVKGCYEYAKAKLGTKKLPETLEFKETLVTKNYMHEGGVAGGVVFLLTDTMKSRKNIVTALTKRCGNSGSETAPPMLIIETRMGSTHGSIFSINPFDAAAVKAWNTTLVDDEDKDNLELSPCGSSLSVGTTASLIANYAVWQMMQFFVDPIGMQPRIDLFFKPTLTIVSSTIAE
jgi:hypothetical protein